MPAPKPRREATREVVEAVGSSVVSISTVGKAGNGVGSGLIISEDGYVLTAHHVIAGTDAVRVILPARVKGVVSEYEAQVIGSDNRTDVALLRIDASGLPFVALDNIAAPKAGNSVVVIGGPYGLNETVTRGIISYAERHGIESNEGSLDTDLIQVDAPINPGNSGGPAFDLRSRYLGMVDSVHSMAQGVGFLVPGAVVARVAEQLKAYRQVRRGSLGIETADVVITLPESPHDHIAAIRITGFEPGSAGQRAGLEIGDFVLQLDDDRVVDRNGLNAILVFREPGETVLAHVIREDGAHAISVALGEPASPAKKPASPARRKGGRVGKKGQTLTP